MRLGFYLPLMVMLSLVSCGDRGRPPFAEVKVVTDDYFGVKVDDPYRYMEDIDDPVFLGWMKQQAVYTRTILDEIPGRDGLVSRFQEIDARASDRVYGLSITDFGRYFYLKITPNDEVGKLYYRDGYEADEKLLFDPSDYKIDEGQNYVISTYRPDYNGEKVAIFLAPDGSESNTIIVQEVSSGMLFKDIIDQSTGSFSWLRSSDAFIYGKTNSDNVHDQGRFLDTKIYYHKLGDLQSRDQLFFSSAMNPSVMMDDFEMPYIYYEKDLDVFYLLLYTVERYLRVFEASAADFKVGEAIRWRNIIEKDDEIQEFFADDEKIYLYTAKGAPNFNLLSVDRGNPDMSNAVIVVPEPEDGMLSGVSFTEKGLYYKIKYNGVEERLFRKARYFDSPVEIELPARAGYISLSSLGFLHSDIWITLTGWTQDNKRYRINEEDLTLKFEPLSSKASYPEYDDLIVKEVMVSSHDGVRVPLSIVYKQGTELDGSAPLLVSGYGAYGSSRIPSFNPYMLSWTLKGGVFAVAHVRGGGELGDAWRLAGNKSTKPNTWKDMIACVEYLHDNKYSTSSRTAMYGGSAGGVLVGMAMTERPDLFAAVIPLVGLMNAVRMELSPNGPVNTPEFGSVKDSAECMSLIAMDAYLNVKDGVNYPATLVTAGFNDPRVIVWQPAKFAARLQAANSSKHPILLDVDYSSGHGVGDTKSKSFEDLADVLSFAFWQCGHSEFQ